MARIVRGLGLLVLVLGIASGCARAPLKEARDALRPVSTPALSDDLELEPLVDATVAQADFIAASPGFQTFVFGERTYTKAEYLAGLRLFAELARKAESKEAFLKQVEANFDFYEVYGRDRSGEIFMTSYYEPVVPGSLKRTERFSAPLYRVPTDLVALDLTLFDAQKYALDRKWRGRVVDRKLIPYFSREEIDVGGALKGRKLELVWVDPLDAFLIHVQGSATIELGRGKRLRVGYADKNGHSYEALGRFVKEFIKPEEMSLQAIEQYVRSLPPEKMQEYLNKNPSYVFFAEMEGPGLTSIGLAPTAGRTVAVDARFFPKGTVAFLSSTKPKWDPQSSSPVPKEWEPFSRFVLDQDTGGAITGGGRLDLFWGSGDEAKRNAGVIRQIGKLYYLAPKLERK